jgi:hypothetical protein
VASPLSVGAAGKGLEPDAIKYSDAKHLNLQPVTHMIEATAHARKDLKEFMADGHVGAAAQ